MSAYRVIIEKSAMRSMANMQWDVRKRVDTAILSLADTPRPPGCKMLKGKYGAFYRIRVGDYRIVYRIEDARLIVCVITVAHRREVYR